MNINYLFCFGGSSLSKAGIIADNLIKIVHRVQVHVAEFSDPRFDVTWDGYTAETPCWVRRLDDGSITVFAINCTHLGCPVRWFPESSLFMCPCHRGVYYADGTHAAGPPPRGLYTYQIDQDAMAKGRLRILGGRLPTLQEPT